MLKQYHIREFHFKLVLYALILSGIGILLVGSAERSLQNKQVLGLALGLVVMLVVSLVDYSFLMNFCWIFYVLNLGLLLLVRFFGDNSGGATRWIDFGWVRFQPSELTKIILILFFAKFFAERRDEISQPKNLALSFALLGAPLFLVVKQPDLSTSIVIAMIFVTMLFCGGLSYKIVGSVLAVAVPLVIVFMSLVIQPDQEILHGYQSTRILAWLQPEKFPDEAMQQQNSIMAIGSGQLTGKGLNNNVIASVKNGNFISEPQTDFIFAVAGEELGFVGCCAIVILLLLMVLECLWIGRNAKDTTGTLICCGTGAFIGFQTFFNIGVTTGLLPNTGLPLPFLSYGLTSLVSLFVGIGLVLNVGLQRRKH